MDKLVDALQLDNELTNIADAIRSRTGGTEPIAFSDFANSILNIDSAEDLKAIIEGTLISFLNVPAGTQVIRKYAFEEYPVQDPQSPETALIWLRDSVEEIKEFAFYRSGFTDIRTGSRLETMGESAFASSPYLVQIHLGASQDLSEISNYAFQDCKALRQVILHPYITEIGAYAFSDCDLIEFPIEYGGSYLRRIGNFAFYRSTAGTNPITALDLSIFTGLAEIGRGAFMTEPDNSGVLTSVAFPAALITIGEDAFRKGNIQSADFSRCSNLKTIGNNAFRGQTARGLQTVDLSACVNLETIGDYAFHLTGMKTLDLSNCAKLKSISQYMAAYTNGPDTITNPSVLTALDLSDCAALETIGRAAFCGDSMLSLVLPNHTLTSIGQYCFAGQTHLTGALTVDAASLGGDAFNRCGISSVVVKNCDSFGVAVFGNCANLTEARITKKPTTLPGTLTTYPVFNNCSRLTDIYVPWSSGEVPENKFVKSDQTVTWHYDTVF